MKTLASISFYFFFLFSRKVKTKIRNMTLHCLTESSFLLIYISCIKFNKWILHICHSLICEINCGVPCCFTFSVHVNLHLAGILISSNVMEIMDIFRMCLAAVTFTQYKHIIQMICASSVTNQSHNISTQILCKFKVSL